MVRIEAAIADGSKDKVKVKITVTGKARAAACEIEAITAKLKEVEALTIFKAFEEMISDTLNGGND